MTEYTGSRWYKCDLHLHTMSSICYVEKNDTPEQWVKRAIEQGLDAVAVTDHNDYRGIKDIMEEGQKQGLSVFPGVEITCDSSKIHILIIFDTNKTAETVRDFLNRCDIDSENIGDPSGTSLGVFEVCEIAKKRGALVIAAHIDEFSSINSMNPANLDRLLESGLLDAVQVANLPVWRKYQQDKDVDSMNRTLLEKYGPDATPAEVERWRKCFARAEEAGIPMVAFSDNPYSETSGKHGLWGIGSTYTWIQMDDDVDIESIHQSLITPESRIRMIYDSVEKPKTEPAFWIRSIDIRNTELNPHVPIHLDFHPQLNCIIGGRGSGKSSIVRVLMGVYKQLPNEMLRNIVQEEKLFYSQYADDGHGIFKEDSEITIHFTWYGSRYILVITDIVDTDHQKYTFYKYNSSTDEKELLEWDEIKFRALMSAQVFAEREINAITSTPGGMLAHIDSLIHDMYILKAKRRFYEDTLINLAHEAHSLQKFIKNDYRLNLEMDWFNLLSDQKQIPDEFASNFTEMLDLRNSTISMIDECLDRISAIKENKTIILKKLDQVNEDIRRFRVEFIDHTLKDDENYKMEVKPFASHESLYKMLSDALKVDLSLIHEDVKKLENALFAKKDGIQKYSELLIRKEGFSDYFTHLLNNLSDIDFGRMLLFRPEDELFLFYHPTGVKRFFSMNNASSGELATAMFSFFLFSGRMPLVIDQPESDMDNRIIYDEILSKLKKAKQMRQLILVTHNANIAANADSEMIISLESGQKFIKVRSHGTMDNDQIRRDLCDIIEGSEKAFKQRARKYHID